jgi:hypothetical protein
MAQRECTKSTGRAASRNGAAHHRPTPDTRRAMPAAAAPRALITAKVPRVTTMDFPSRTIGARSR